MKTRLGEKIGIAMLVLISAIGCSQKSKEVDKTAAEILGNPEYPAISYGGYRQHTRDVQPTIEELKDESENFIKIRKEGVHFDLEHKKRIDWENSGLEDFREKLENRIKATII